MSIETLLEAAKFLELLAQQQQKTHEDELKERLRLEQQTDQKRSEVNSPLHKNNVIQADELRTEPAPLSLPPPSTPVAVLPVVTQSHAASPIPSAPTLSPPRIPSPCRDSRPVQEQSVAAPPHPPHLNPDPPPSVLTAEHMHLLHNNNHHHHQHHPQLLLPANNAKLHQQLVQCYPGSIVSPPQRHALVPPSALLQQNGPISRGSRTDDPHSLDSKKRPGGAGTREVHNKLEQNRRAHLKECFETLKKNLPNIDEKKTSNLSVLRSALRYIQTLKRKEKEYEHDMERLAREKIATKQRLEDLKKDLSQWMDAIEIDRVLRQTVQPEEDQASTSTASEGEDTMDEDLDEDSVPRVSPNLKPDHIKPTAPAQVATPAPAPAAPFVTQRISFQHRAPTLQTLPMTLSQPAAPPPPITCPAPALLTAHKQMVTAPGLQPTVIARASVSHASVIQAVNQKHLAHITTTASPAHFGPAHHQTIGHITVHPVAHLGQHLPPLYPQAVAVTQPGMVHHVTHVNGTTPAQQGATIISKQTTVGTQMVTHHPQLVGQTVLNPVTMVTMPSFPISTLKLA